MFQVVLLRYYFLFSGVCDLLCFPVLFCCFTPCVSCVALYFPSFNFLPLLIALPPRHCYPAPSLPLKLVWFFFSLRVSVSSSGYVRLCVVAPCSFVSLCLASFWFYLVCFCLYWPPAGLNTCNSLILLFLMKLFLYNPHHLPRLLLGPACPLSLSLVPS